jgi:prepilin-type N-terminal cleavage/methylation domain-containing protein
MRGKSMQQKRQPNIAQQSGFTIVELMIATVVFSVVLLITTVAVIFVTKSYLKGDNEAATQDIARSVMTSITQDIQFNRSVSVIIPPAGGTSNYYCIGNHVYVYQIGQEIPNSEQHALLVFATSCPSNLTSPPGSTYAADLKSGNVGATVAQELLAQNMRLGQLSITKLPGTGNGYQVSITVAYGADDLLTGVGANYSCKSQTFGGQFCAVSTLTTTVTSRIK